jgi:hypothetical protein
MADRQVVMQIAKKLAKAVYGALLRGFENENNLDGANYKCRKTYDFYKVCLEAVILCISVKKAVEKSGMMKLL